MAETAAPVAVQEDASSLAFTKMILIAQTNKQIVDVWAVDSFSVDKDENVVLALSASAGVIEYPYTKLNFSDAKLGASFEDANTIYAIRPIRESDGVWISHLETTLPGPVVAAAAEELPDAPEEGEAAVEVSSAETLRAVALDDSPYIVGLVLSTDSGEWFRTGATWLSLATEDTLYSAEGTSSFEIDPARGNEFIDLYDKNYVSVSDAEAFAKEVSAEADAEE